MTRRTALVLTGCGETDSARWWVWQGEGLEGQHAIWPRPDTVDVSGEKIELAPLAGGYVSQGERPQRTAGAAAVPWGLSPRAASGRTSPTPGKWAHCARVAESHNQRR